VAIARGYGQTAAVAAGEGFDGKVAIVTGGGSGIGAALAAELRRRGATVVAADVVGGDAPLDVRDREGFAALVGEVAAEHGRLDLLFNNAGISLGGETHLMDGSYFDRIIDVNLGGVVNGVLAAYPLMVDQGHGHIVNTASMAGLAPTPLVAGYAMTKHGVVGLSTSLRAEAARHGVRVSVLCPGSIDTPILDSSPPGDLPAPAPSTVTGREFMAIIKQKPVPAASVAGPALRGVARNRAVIIVPASAKALWYLQRLSPGAMQAAGRLVVGRVLRTTER
jgi:NAD(P)-dependent dehydrogenase (short-subunit alcohol dehydrogenase family)